MWSSKKKKTDLKIEGELLVNRKGASRREKGEISVDNKVWEVNMVKVPIYMYEDVIMKPISLCN
jgi:hypothetical protein